MYPPSVQVFGPAGNATVAAVENLSKYGLLSETFGQYHSSNIHFMTFEKGRFTVTDTTPLDGYVYDTACSDDALLAADADDAFQRAGLVEVEGDGVGILAEGDAILGVPEGAQVAVADFAAQIDNGIELLYLIAGTCV